MLLLDLNKTVSWKPGAIHKADRVASNLVDFLRRIKCSGESIAAYGAAAKGNTLLNYSGIDENLLPLVYDASPSKQGKYLPGSRIPIKDPKHLRQNPPDFVLVLPWNLSAEIAAEFADLIENGTIFISAFDLESEELTV